MEMVKQAGVGGRKDQREKEAARRHPGRGKERKLETLKSWKARG